MALPAIPAGGRFIPASCTCSLSSRHDLPRSQCRAEFLQEGGRSIPSAQASSKRIQGVCRNAGEEARNLEGTSERLRSAAVKTARSIAVVMGSAALMAASAAAALAAEEITCQQELGGADPNTVFVVACVVEALALTGAATGGILARQRKQEMEVINSQLRQINISLRKQARLESYAPGLSYAPVGGPALVPTRAGERVATQTSPPKTEGAKGELMRKLRSGKRYLREGVPSEAAKEFEAALTLARSQGDSVQEKKAARGLGASKQRQRLYKDAIVNHKRVLEISGTTGEHSGDTDALGAIADCYTELGDLECAAKYYDKYIGCLESGAELDNQD